MSLALAVAAVVLLGDQAAKAAIRGSLGPGMSHVVIPHVLSWTYVQNTHTSFGLFAARPYLLAALTFPVLAMILAGYRRVFVDSPPVQLAFGAILGGALGNVWDRVHIGFVTDFVDVKVWTETFNVADAAITLGFVVLAIVTLLRRRSTTPAAH